MHVSDDENKTNFCKLSFVVCPDLSLTAERCADESCNEPYYCYNGWCCSKKSANGIGAYPYGRFDVFDLLIPNTEWIEKQYGLYITFPRPIVEALNGVDNNIVEIIDELKEKLEDNKETALENLIEEIKEKQDQLEEAVNENQLNFDDVVEAINNEKESKEIQEEIGN
ncbi:hypothetical protein T11_13966 [Trichinella zimbabwensis]|uniref:Uncharacterized protein n=1 Tax=Trichinella zimbabwensis TaxID=268475 RepID=A0A0V1GWG1_9BILA|nr:hypothetical protein T11_13966 [Trichinella zimbabwensis]